MTAAPASRPLSQTAATSLMGLLQATVTWPRAWPRMAVVLACLAGVVSVLRDALLLVVVGFGVTWDSHSWMEPFVLRTRPYSIMAALTGASISGHPLGLVWLQVAVAAFATAAVVYIIARQDLALAAVAGTFLLLDMNWSAANRWVMPESPFISFHLISLACLAIHVARRRSLRPWELTLAGALYGWTAAIRPSGLLSVVPIVLAYVFFMQSRRKIGFLLIGLASVLVALALLTYRDTGRLRLYGDTGIYLGFPLFSYHLVVPENGPASRTLDATVRSCDPDYDFTKITPIASNEFFNDILWPCLHEAGWLDEQIHGTVGRAYLESMLNRPGHFARAIIDQNGAMATYAVGSTILPLDLVTGAATCAAYAYCDDAIARAGRHPEAKALLEGWRASLAGVTVETTQAYLSVASVLTTTPLTAYIPYDGLVTRWRSDGLVLVAAWTATLVLVAIGTRGPVLVLALGCVAFLHYTMLSVVVGHVFISRYALVLSPFHAIVSAAALLTLGRLARAAVAAVAGGGSRMVAVRPAPARALDGGVHGRATGGEPSTGAGPLSDQEPPRRRRDGVPTFGRPAWLLVALCAVLLGGAVLVRSALMGANGGDGTGGRLPLTAIARESGYAYVAPLPTDRLSAHLGASPAQILEDGVPLPLANALHDDIRQFGGGRFSFWHELVYFSASDNTDPRVNGRTYEAFSPAASDRSPVRWPWYATIVVLLPLTAFGVRRLGLARGWRSGASLSDLDPSRHPRTGVWIESTAAAKSVLPTERRKDWRLLAPVAIPALAAVLPSFIQFMLVPPVYTDLTIAHVILIPSNIMPHYPPLYGYFLWAVNALGNAICPGDGGIGDCGLYATVLLQHALFSAAILYFAIGCAQTVWGRLLSIAPFYVVPIFMIVNHGMQTEGPWFSLVMFMVAASYRIVTLQRTSVSPFLVVYLALVAALLIRPSALFLAPMLPIALLLAFVMERRRGSALILLGVAGLIAASVLTGELVFRGSMAANGMEYRSPWGRGTIEVLQRIVWRLETGEVGRPPARGETLLFNRESLIPPLQANTSDPVLRNAIPTLVTYLDRTYDGTDLAGVWGGAHTALMRTGSTDVAGNPVQIDLPHADRLVNQFCVLFMRTFPDLMLESTATTFVGYLRWSYEPAGAFIRGVIWVQLGALQGMLQEGWLNVMSARDMWIVRHNDEAIASYAALHSSPYIRFADEIRVLHALLALLGLSGAGLLWRRLLLPRHAFFVLAGLLATTVYLVAVSFLLVGILRYLLPVQLVLCLLIGTVLGRFADTDLGDVRRWLRLARQRRSGPPPRSKTTGKLVQATLAAYSMLAYSMLGRLTDSVTVGSRRAAVRTWLLATLGLVLVLHLANTLWWSAVNP